MLSCFLLTKALKNAKKVKQEKKPAARVFGLVLKFLGYIVWPVFLMTFTKVLLNTPLWVVRSYVPDLYFIIILSALLAVAGGIINLFEYFFSRMNSD